MSEFPEWLEQRMGPWWDPSYEQSRQIHQWLRSGELREETINEFFQNIPVFDSIKSPSAWSRFRAWFS